MPVPRLWSTGNLFPQMDRDKGNGYRLGYTYGHRRKLEFRTLRDRFGNFLELLMNQEEESE